MTEPQQLGDFVVNVRGIPIRIEQDGIFGIGATFGAHLNFAAHAVNYQRPFISNTGYRSFMGVHSDMPVGMTPDTFAAEVLKVHIDKELKGKLQKIERSYVEREMERRKEAAQPHDAPNL